MGDGQVGLAAGMAAVLKMVLASAARGGSQPAGGPAPRGSATIKKPDAGAITLYVRWVDAVNRVVGRFVMYLIFVMIGVLLLSSASRTSSTCRFIWIVEMAQFLLAAYYLLGGGYSMQLDSMSGWISSTAGGRRRRRPSSTP